MADFPLVLAILGLCLGPFLLLALAGTLWSFAMPFAYLWGMLTSGKNLDNMIQDTIDRERATKESLGRDPLTRLMAGTGPMFMILDWCMPAESSDLVTGTC